MYLRGIVVPSDEEHGGVLSGLNAETRQRLTDRAVTTTLLAVAKREPLAIISTTCTGWTIRLRAC